MLDSASWLTWMRQNQADVSMHHPRIVLMLTQGRSVVVQQLLDEQKVNPDSPKIAYFYCNGSEQQRTKTQEILGSIARQLSFNGLDKPPEPALLEVYSAQKKDADEKNADQIERLNIKGLTDLIPKIVGDRTAIVLIDALDECTERSDLLGAIKTIMKKASVKVIISGRSEVCPDMPKNEFPVHVLIGQGENGDDIRKFVTAEVNRAIFDRHLLRGKVSDHLKGTIVQKLNSSAQGMYVYRQKRMRLRRPKSIGVQCCESRCFSDPTLVDQCRIRKALWLNLLNV